MSEFPTRMICGPESEWPVLPGAFGTGPENIVVIRNFIEAEDLAQIQQFCPTINKWNNSTRSVYAEDGTCLYNAEYWQDRTCSSWILEELSPTIYELVNKYIVKMKETIEQHFRVKLEQRPPVIMCWRPGIEQLPHADKQVNDGRPNAFPTYDLNSLFYYNDDFEGGELYYPQHNITIKPEPGMAVFHPGDIHYLHGVSMITEGLRYTTPSFYTVTEFLD
jgi:hypothetical protein